MKLGDSQKEYPDVEWVDGCAYLQVTATGESSALTSGDAARLRAVLDGAFPPDRYVASSADKAGALKHAMTQDGYDEDVVNDVQRAMRIAAAWDDHPGLRVRGRMSAWRRWCSKLVGY